MAITFDASAEAGSQGYVASVSCNITIGDGNDNILVAFMKQHGATQTSFKVGTTNLTAVPNAANPYTISGSRRSYLYYITGLSAGTYTVTWDGDVNSKLNTLILLSYHGVDQTTPFNVNVEETSGTGSDTISDTIASATDELVLGFSVAEEFGCTWSTGTGQTTRKTGAHGGSGIDVWSIASEKAGASSVSMSHTCTYDSNTLLSLALVALRPANVTLTPDASSAIMASVAPSLVLDLKYTLASAVAVLKTAAVKMNKSLLLSSASARLSGIAGTLAYIIKGVASTVVSTLFGRARKKVISVARIEVTPAESVVADMSPAVEVNINETTDNTVVMEV